MGLKLIISKQSPFLNISHLVTLMVCFTSLGHELIFWHMQLMLLDNNFMNDMPSYNSLVALAVTIIM
jgi:hypothetical protein